METIVEQLSEYELEPHRRTGGKPKSTLNHSIVQGNLVFALQLHYRQEYTFAPELNLTMPDRPDAVPDIAVYPKLQIDFLRDITSMTAMPLTVIEIVSPSQSDAEIIAKFERYFRAGVQSCWLVMPVFKAISVYVRLEQYTFFPTDATLTDPTTGIELPLSDIFA